MAEFTRELFLHALEEWDRYAEVFGGLPAAEQTDFLRKQGFSSAHDLLAHIGAWWEEARGIIGEVIAHRERQAHKYNFDEFNAAAILKYKENPEGEFQAWYEAQQKEITALVSALTDEQLKLTKVSNWLDGVILEHLKVHAVNAPRFLIIDTLQREWADGPGHFRALSSEEQAEFLQKQGFARLRDLAAHVIAWWEQGIDVIESASDAGVGEAQDVDTFNAEAVNRFSTLDEAEVWATYDKTRLTLMNLVDSLPDEVFSKPNVQAWLKADVLDHYFEHAI